MFEILAKTLKIASRTTARTSTRWSAPDHWHDHDHRTRAQKERDAQERRRMLRQTGMM
ncbi:hypothetical protein [Jannaschia sp. CCS1]|uniref:hypothetical protein n=1 Tax=Jannaschia sp. (strain CCS1) TaxID=290400 RepID=UPI00031CE1A5|nr:hypothetical protein [Jannaschia sp. CCS1]